MKIAHHAVDDVDLLGVLLAKVGVGGTGEIEEHKHDGGDAAKVAGPRRAFASSGKRGFLDMSGVVGRVNIRRSEDDIDPGLAAEGEVPAAGPGIAGKVFAGAELGRIDVDGDDDAPAFLASAADKRKMALMQGAHGRDKSDALAGTDPVGAETPDGFWRGNDFHGSKLEPISKLAKGALRVAARLRRWRTNNLEIALGKFRLNPCKIPPSGGFCPYWRP